jgi:ubiquinone biosynthesis protein Coq4
MLNTALADFDPEQLESCPFGSLGFKCWAFVRANNLRPLMFRGRLDASDVGSSLAARRVLLNDALHVLLGFDADAVGEVGVFSFVAAQNYCQRFEREARELAQLYVTLLPWLRDDFQAAEYRGRELAAAAPPLLAIPLEREWNAPLTPLQAQLRLKTLRTLRPMSWEQPQ